MTASGHPCPLCRGTGEAPTGKMLFLPQRRQQPLRIVIRELSESVRRHFMGPGQAEIRRWRDALAGHLSDEGLTTARRRTKRAEKRAATTVYVPPANAPPRCTGDRTDRYGQFRPAGRPRRGIKMRTAIALWAHGFGADAVIELATLAGVEASATAVGRLFAQARADFPGAEAIRAADLAAELPLPELTPDAPASLASRMKLWRAQFRVTKTRAARLAAVTPAMWRRLEAGGQTRKQTALDSIERTIARRPPPC